MAGRLKVEWGSCCLARLESIVYQESRVIEDAERKDEVEQKKISELGSSEHEANGV